jgi:hypothetical protein
MHSLNCTDWVSVGIAIHATGAAHRQQQRLGIFGSALGAAIDALAEDLTGDPKLFQAPRRMNPLSEWTYGLRLKERVLR